ncbi:rubrerythrin [Beduini massiliensis]|uniref:rubrerythrin n=1 Tax=Beduini massiliensis TaxID=1585974 RepID=UPI000A97BDD9|nr:rubrerythrin family protein [Beduini massiliensis]
MVDFKTSQTKDNLMRAFAGESQARNRYTFAAGIAVKQKQHMIADVFLFTANQEKEHAEIFYNHLQQLAGETIFIDGGYPIDLSDDVISLLKSAHHNEYEEYQDVYQNFSEIAKQEGFLKVAQDFKNIADIEKTHGDRFLEIAALLEKNQLYVSNVTCRWMCLNCGFIYEGTAVPERCPVCDHDQGYFIRIELAPYTK